jgi:hypothetical protein
MVAVSDTQITVTTPGHGTAETVDVRVTTPSGISAVVPTDVFTYTATVPVVTGLSPATGPAAGGTPVTIYGSRFGGTTEVDFGTHNAPILSVSDTEINVTSPYQLAPGIVDVQVKGPNGNSNTSGTADDFVYTATTPVVTGLSPSSGTVAGGTMVTISGNGFGGTSSVQFGSVYATILTVSDTIITVTSPYQLAPGIVDVQVNGQYGNSDTLGAADNFTYTDIPNVTGISPTLGPVAGGINVTISGSQFTGTTSVQFGSTYATILTVSDSAITVLSPGQGSAGTVHVTVTKAGGTSATSDADNFTYTNGPIVTGISPTSGPRAGGTNVTISGIQFAGTSRVRFGSTAGTIMTISDTTITVLSPQKYPAGTVDVRVITANGTSAVSSSDQFTYL